jgi:hypothetical protein
MFIIGIAIWKLQKKNRAQLSIIQSFSKNSERVIAHLLSILLVNVLERMFA